MEEKETKKKKKFNLYDFLNGTNSKGDTDDERNKKRNLSYFFTLFGRNFSRIFELNLIFVLGNIPFVFILLAISGITSASGSAADSSIFAQIFAVSEKTSATPALAALFGIYGLQQTVNVMTWKTWLCYGLGALTLITYGPVSCACFYNFRNIVAGKPVMILSDAWDTIKKNWKNGLVLGIIDLLLVFVISYDIISFYYNIGSFFMNFCFWLSIACAVIYFFMRMYIYILTVTFDLKIFKVIKNAFIFSFLGFKRNIVAAIGIALAVFINYLLMLLPQTFGLGLILPFVITIGVVMFMMAYAAWPKIKEIMIDPYYNPDGTPIEEAQ